MNGETQTEPTRRRKPRAARVEPVRPVDFKPLLTLAAVAELLDKTPAQIRNMRSRRQMPAELAVVIPGLGLRFKAEKVRAWIAVFVGDGEPS